MTNIKSADVRDKSGTADLPTSVSRWLALPEVQIALNAGDRVFNEDNGVKVFEALRENDMVTSLPYLQQVMERMRALVMHGQYDWVCNSIGFENLLERFLVWDGKNELAPLPRKRDWRVNGDLVGYHRVAGNLTQVVFLDAGHMVPQDQPEYAFRLIQQFLVDLEETENVVRPLPSLLRHAE